jgi:hypothetical protein
MSDLIFKTGGTEIEKTKQEIEVKMNWSEHTKIQRKEMQKQIEELQEQLQKLEEISPVEEAYKDAYGKYPVKVISEELTSEDNWNVISWSAFQKGYNASKVSETPQEPEDNEWTIEKLQEKNWYVDVKTLLKSKEPEENDWKTVALLFGKKLPVIPPYGYDELSPNAWYTWVVFNYDYYIKQRDIESGRYPTPPQTPEQIEKSLRTAFGKHNKQKSGKKLKNLLMKRIMIRTSRTLLT